MPSLHTSIINNGQWRDLRRPFRHFHATRVLESTVYNSVAKMFSTLLLRSPKSRRKLPSFTKSVYNNDLVLPVDECLAEDLPAIFSESSIRSLYGILDLPFLPRIDAEMHSHPKGSPSGFIHTDYSETWFDESFAPLKPMIRFPSRFRCDSVTGEVKVRSAIPAKYVRAATLIFYLCNDGWREGDGGETALYEDEWETPDISARLIPPANNSLLLFRCSPHSYHRFVTNPGCVRNSIVLRLYSTSSNATFV
jgi:hypothetical protein